MTAAGVRMACVAVLLWAQLLAAYAVAVPRAPTKEALVQDAKGRLSPEELRKISSIACLKARQKDPRASCEGLKDGAPGGVVTPATLRNSDAPTAPPEHFGIGDWPHWSDERCNSHGEFLCDPGGALMAGSQARVADLLKGVREQVTVTCRRLDAKLGPQEEGGPCSKSNAIDTTTRKFNLGVVVANEWPQSEADTDTLQKFGLYVLNRWGLMPIYNGVDTRNAVDPPLSMEEYTTNCPNSALLIVLPSYNQVFLSAPSCEFICNDRGGPEVATRVQHALDSEAGLEEAISMGIEEISSILKTAQMPLSMQGGGAWKERYALRNLLKNRSKFANTESAWVLGQNAFLMAFIALTVFVVLAFTYYNLSVSGNIASALALLRLHNKH